MSLLGIDIGTTGCKAAVFSTDGKCLGEAYSEYSEAKAAPGAHELDATDVWNKARAVIAEAASKAKADPITALCTSSCGEAVVPVSRDRKILGSSILSSDPRGREYVDRLLSRMSREQFYAINPNILGPNYSMPKILWLRDNAPDLYNRTDLFLYWGDMVGFMLGCDPVTGNSHANRSLLYDLRKDDWSDELLAWSGIPRGKFGKVKPGGTVAGMVSDAAAAGLGLPKGVKVVVGGHDQCCNSLGAGNIRAGSAVCGIGTYECITPAFSTIPPMARMLANGLNVEHHVLPGLYVSFLFNQAGMLVKWFRDTFARADALALGGRSIYDALTAEMPAEPTKLLVLPYFEISGSPRFITDASGLIAGLRTSTKRGEILKAIMECSTLYFVESIRALKEMGIDTSEFIATGGGAKSDQWLQIKADIFGVPFIRPKITEGSVLGAAMLAGLSTGVFKSPAEAARQFVKRDRVFEPDKSRHEAYRAKHEAYTRLFESVYPVIKDCGN